MSWDAIGATGEIIGALAVVVSLGYLAVQLRMSNKLARSEAYRTPNSLLTALNSSFGLNPEFQLAIRKILNGANRMDLQPNERTMTDYNLVSLCNIYDQLTREVREGILDRSARDFGGKGLFRSSLFFPKLAAVQAAPWFRLRSRDGNRVRSRD